MGKGKGIFTTIRNLLLKEWKNNDAAELAVVMYHGVLKPVGLSILTLFILLSIYQRVRRRYIWTARDLHEEALRIYQRSNNPKKSTTANVLEEAIARDPTYRPAYLSLAALYLYPRDDSKYQKQRRPDLALQVLERCKEYCGMDGSIRALELDAIVIQQGEEHMIQDVLMQAEYLSRAFVKAANKTNKISTAQKKQSMQPPESAEESKKER
jgi:hypothetical protein